MCDMRILSFRIADRGSRIVHCRPPIIDRRSQLERVGFVGIERDGGAEAAGAEEGIDSGEGVGKLVGVAQRTFEEVVLGFGGEGGEKLEVEDRDG